MYTGIGFNMGLILVTYEGDCVLSKYKTSPIFPGNVNSVLTILPNGLTFILPTSGSSIDVITPNDFSTSAVTGVFTILKTP